MSAPATEPSDNRKWIVAFAGVGINLALGLLYTWSMVKDAIAKEFVDWKPKQLNDPYAICCLVFAFAMIVAGKCQDRFGPRLTASLGGALVAAGVLLISQSNSYLVWLLGFGVLAGIGIGFGYASATPAAMKWFPSKQTGMIAGLVVAGFGLAPVYLSPLSKFLLAEYGLRQTMAIYGVGFFVVVCGLAQLLLNPPTQQVSAASTAPARQAIAGASPGEMLRHPTFYLLWVIYFIGAGSGLMVIGSISGMAKKSMGSAVFVAVAVMAIGNAVGRLAAGYLSDRIGRRQTLALVLGFQAVLMFVAIPVTASKTMEPAVVVLVATLIGFNYGANLSLFPSCVKDFWGLRSFGVNYGLLFTAWGVGGFVLSPLQQRLTTQNGGSYTASFCVAGGLLVLGTLLTFLIKAPQKAAQPETPHSSQVVGIAPLR